MHIKYRKDQMKTEGAYPLWKKGWWTDNGRRWWRTARYRISSADYVSSGAKKKYSQIFFRKQTKPEMLTYFEAQNWAHEAHILRTSMSRFTEHVKHHWCNIRGNILQKWPKTGFFLLILKSKMVQIWASEAQIIYMPLNVAPMGM